MPNSHIVSSFDDALNQLRTRIFNMAELVSTQFSEAERALVEKDLNLANLVRQKDKQVDHMIPAQI